MKNKRSFTKTLIIVLSILLVILLFSVCVIFILKVGSIGAGIVSAVDSAAVTKNPAVSATPGIKSSETDSDDSGKYPDVILPTAVPDPEFSLSSSEEDTTATSDPADIVDSVKDGVVAIINYHYSTKTGSYFAYGTASGFIVSEKGYIFTNAHAVSDAKKLEVTLSNGNTVEATMVGFDLTTDIAVISIPESDVSCVLTLGNSENVRVGEYVLAIGNPIGQENLYGSVSLGVVSGTNREVNIDGFTNTYIQTDAALNPGNSGGPLIDLTGKVIGMNTAKSISAGYDDYGNSISSEGIGFALPINDVITIANTLIQNGELPRPGIGISVYTITAEDAAPYGLVAGVYVDSVNTGSPAEAAGIKAGDVIVKFNGVEMADKDVLVEAVRAVSIGETATVTVYRAGEYLELQLSIGNMNEFNN